MRHPPLRHGRVFGGGERPWLKLPRTTWRDSPLRLKAGGTLLLQIEQVELLRPDRQSQIVVNVQVIPTALFSSVPTLLSAASRSVVMVI